MPWTPKRRAAARWFPAVAALACAPGAAAAEPDAVALMREHTCYTCHADHEALAGPSFAEIAAGYRGNRDAVAILARFIRNGASSGGPWHMPPHPEIPAADAARMARYIVSLEQRHAPAQ